MCPRALGMFMKGWKEPLHFVSLQSSLLPVFKLTQGLNVPRLLLCLASSEPLAGHAQLPVPPAEHELCSWTCNKPRRGP